MSQARCHCAILQFKMVPEAGIAPATSAWKAVMFLSTPLGQSPAAVSRFSRDNGFSDDGEIGGPEGSRTLRSLAASETRL